MIEVWKDIPGFERYQLSNMGRVRSCRKPGVWKDIKLSYLGARKYARPCIRLSKGAEDYTFQVGRLMWEVFVSPIPEGMFIDHIDGDAANNVLKNLRLCTHAENMRNRKVTTTKKQTSVFKGVSFSKPSQKWVAEIRVDKVKKHLGLFTTEIEAAHAYDEAAKFHFKEFAQPNFREVQ